MFVYINRILFIFQLSLWTWIIFSRKPVSQPLASEIALLPEAWCPQLLIELFTSLSKKEPTLHVRNIILCGVHSSACPSSTVHRQTFCFPLWTWLTVTDFLLTYFNHFTQFSDLSISNLFITLQGLEKQNIKTLLHQSTFLQLWLKYKMELYFLLWR